MLPDATIRNRILSLLPPPELEAVLEPAEMVTIQSKEIVYEREQPIRFAHFPEDCVISLVTELENGDQIDQKVGLIAHRRGNITVVNRAGLEKASCECYRTIRARQTKLIA